MSSSETALFSLGVPAVAWIAGAVAVLSAAADLRSRDPTAVPAGSGGRLWVYLAVTATTVLFGVVLWKIASGLEDAVGGIPEPEATLFRWVAIGFAWAAVVATGVQAWIARTRLPQFAGLNFPRVLPFVTLPTTLVVFSLVIGFLALGRISDSLLGAIPMSDPQAANVVLALQIYALSSLALPITAIRARRISDLSRTQDFVRALVLNDIGVFPAIAALTWTFLQLAAS